MYKRNESIYIFISVNTILNSVYPQDIPLYPIFVKKNIPDLFVLLVEIDYIINKTMNILFANKLTHVRRVHRPFGNIVWV